MSKPPPLPEKAPKLSGAPPPLPAAGPSVPSFDGELEKIGFTRSLTRRRKLEFSGRQAGQSITGSLEARTRTKYAGEVRYRELSGFRLFVESPAQTNGRMVLTHKVFASRLTRWLNRKGNLSPVSLPATLRNLEAWAADVSWAECLLHDPEMIPHLAVLIPDRSVTKSHAFQWYGDKLVYTSFGGKGAQATLIADVVARVAGVTARTIYLPKPTIMHRPGWMEKHPVGVLIVLIVGVLLFAGLGSLLLVLIAVLISR